MLHQPLVHCICVAVLVSLSGCGSSDSLSIDGRVTFQGNLVKQGTIVFLDSSGGHAADGQIVDGSFSIAASQELKAGSYRLEVYATEETGRKIADPDYPGEMVSETRQVLPPRYNVMTELERKLDATTEQLVLDLE